MPRIRRDAVEVREEWRTAVAVEMGTSSMDDEESAMKVEYECDLGALGVVVDQRRREGE